jgi:hypothetical protein
MCSYVVDETHIFISYKSAKPSRFFFNSTSSTEQKEREADQSPLSSTKAKNGGIISALPHTSSLRGP